MRVALTGVSGFIGSVIARDLARAGDSVTGLVRETSRRDHIEESVERFVVGGQSDDSVWDDLLDGADCVIHNSVDWTVLKEPLDVNGHLMSNLLGSIRLLEWSAPRPFVFISTIAVHHDMRPRWRGWIDEDHPLRPATWYGAYKAAVEAHLWQHHFEDGRHTAALRPCGVYGMDPNLERIIGYPIVQRMREKQSYQRSGGGKFVHVDDVSAAAINALTNPEASGKAFNLVDCYARWADWAEIAADLMGIKADIDMSSPSKPKNMFAKDGARTLGVALNRGHEGIREHLRALIERIDETG